MEVFPFEDVMVASQMAKKRWQTRMCNDLVLDQPRRDSFAQRAVPDDATNDRCQALSSAVATCFAARDWHWRDTACRTDLRTGLFDYRQAHSGGSLSPIVDCLSDIQLRLARTNQIRGAVRGASISLGASGSREVSNALGNGDDTPLSTGSSDRGHRAATQRSVRWRGWNMKLSIRTKFVCASTSQCAKWRERCRTGMRLDSID